MTPADLAEIERALREATPGPWYASHMPRGSSVYYDEGEVCDRLFSDRERQQADAELIASAPRWLAELIAALRSEREVGGLLARQVADAQTLIADLIAERDAAHADAIRGWGAAYGNADWHELALREAESQLALAMRWGLDAVDDATIVHNACDRYGKLVDSLNAMVALLSGTVEAQQDEIARLRTELAALRGDERPPLRWDDPTSER